MDNSSTATTVTVDPRLVSFTHLIYALHALSIIIGVLSAKFIVVSFLFSLPSIIAVVLNYVRRSDARGTWLESHFRWQIRTFWFALAAFVVVKLLFGLPALLGIGFLMEIGYVITGIWAAYRVARGWLALKEGRPLPIAGS
jgi:uncharacterized membrane protein